MKMLGSTCLCAALVLGAFSAMAETQAVSPRPAIAERAAALSSKMAMRSDEAQLWLRDARGKGQAARAACLDDKLSELHALERLAWVEEGAIDAAARAGERSGHRMARMKTLAGASYKLHAEARACGKQVSRRVRLRSGYSLKVERPALPGDEPRPRSGRRATTRRIGRR